MHPVWQLDPVFFTIPLIDRPVRYYGIFFAIAFLLGFVLYRHQIMRGGGTDDEAVSFIIPGFIGTVLGARLGHILFYNLDRFLSDPLWLFKVWDGGLASHGAAVGLFLALCYQAWRKKRPLLDQLDRFTFSAALGAALIRLGNFTNSEIVGKVAPDKSPFGVIFPLHDGPMAPPRYPTQLLESALGFFILISLFVADRLLGKEKRPRGALAALFLMMYFAGRFLVEFYKERQGPFDNLLLSRGQMLSIIPFILGLGLLIYVLKRREKEPFISSSSADRPKLSPVIPMEKSPGQGPGPASKKNNKKK
ncbi:MAG: prolipoprotein diacylglyceryl transferase [Deltaproteobacteria bacterium]|jgi:prolipoprotein diacylglyceryl transferase|nr:prolipoprotein diacylglyceryl transferase [Deltaproteobacteria bacterium]